MNETSLCFEESPSWYLFDHVIFSSQHTNNFTSFKFAILDWMWQRLKQAHVDVLQEQLRIKWSIWSHRRFFVCQESQLDLSVSQNEIPIPFSNWFISGMSWITQRRERTR
jgi:hypothetical protein